jgi:hypothetical protein
MTAPCSATGLYVFQSMVREHVAERRLARPLDKYCPEVPGYFLYYPSRV